MGKAASFQRVLLESLESILRPIVRFTMYCGLGHTEFSAIVRRVFIEVASEEYGLRGRPANVSKIAAKTGLPRKQVRLYRKQKADAEWSPDNENSPINTIIHYWRFDERFSRAPGSANRLSYNGENGFVDLVKSCAGDIPASTIRQELVREGIVELTEDGTLVLIRDYAFPELLDEDFVRNAAFAIRHHASTIVHNAILIDSGKSSEEDHWKFGRFERIAWSRRLDKERSRLLKLWVRKEGAEFIQRADEFISELEAESVLPETRVEQVRGVGMYFFEGY